MTLTEFKNYLQNNILPEDKILKIAPEESQLTFLTDEEHNEHLYDFKDKRIDLRDFDLTELNSESNFFNGLGEGYKLIISDKTFGYVEVMLENSYGFKGRFIKLIPNYFRVGEAKMNASYYNSLNTRVENLQKTVLGTDEDTQAKSLKTKVGNLEDAVNIKNETTIAARALNLEQRVNTIESGTLSKADSIKLSKGNYTISVG